MHNFFCFQKVKTLIPPTGIIYNIIKNKKKELTYRVAHIEKKKRIHTKGCGLRFS